MPDGEVGFRKASRYVGDRYAVSPRALNSTESAMRKADAAGPASAMAVKSTSITLPRDTMLAVAL
jgi:hypothetical protein